MGAVEQLEACTRTHRVGLAFPGDVTLRTTWSGTPSGLYRALCELDVDVQPLAAELPSLLAFVPTNALALARLRRTPGRTLKERLQASRTAALFTGREMAALRTMALRRRLRSQPSPHAVIQIGTGYQVPTGYRVATFEDMTVHQALQFPYPEWQALSPREASARIELGRKAYTSAFACCFTSSWAAESAIRDYGVPRHKVHTVGVGRNRTPKPAARDWSTPQFLFVGSDWGRKNGERVVRAFQRVRAHIPAAQLHLVGDHPRVDVEGVTGHGWLSLGDAEERARLDHLFATATCFVMPSLYEPSAIVYVEAAAAGIPSVGTSVGGSAELIGDGGRAIAPDDEDAIVGAMLEFANPATAERVGGLARERADYFTWPNVARRILAALELPS